MSFASVVTVGWSGLWSGTVYAVVGVAEVLYFRSGTVLTVSPGPILVFTALLDYKLQGGGMSALAAIPVCMAAAVLLALVEEFAVLRPLDTAQRTTKLLATVGTGTTVAGLAAVLFTTASVSAGGVFSRHTLTLGPVRLTSNTVLLVAVSMLATLGAGLFTHRTLVGKALWGASGDLAAARMIGVPVGRLRLLARVIVGALLGLTACLYVPVTVMDFTQGLPVSLYGFLAAAIAGYESVPGAVAGGLIFGVLSAACVSVTSSYGDGVAFVIIVLGIFVAQRLRSGRRPSVRMAR